MFFISISATKILIIVTIYGWLSTAHCHCLQLTADSYYLQPTTNGLLFTAYTVNCSLFTSYTVNWSLFTANTVNCSLFIAYTVNCSLFTVYTVNCSHLLLLTVYSLYCQLLTVHSLYCQLLTATAYSWLLTAYTTILKLMDFSRKNMLQRKLKHNITCSQFSKKGLARVRKLCMQFKHPCYIVNRFLFLSNTTR